MNGSLGRLDTGTGLPNHAHGTVAQLGERRTEDAEAAGSSPASPTINPDLQAAKLGADAASLSLLLLHLVANPTHLLCM